MQLSCCCEPRYVPPQKIHSKIRAVRSDEKGVCQTNMRCFLIDVTSTVYKTYCCLELQCNIFLNTVELFLVFSLFSHVSLCLPLSVSDYVFLFSGFRAESQYLGQLRLLTCSPSSPVFNWFTLFASDMQFKYTGSSLYLCQIVS